MDVPFNKPYLTGNELSLVKDAFEKRKFSGNGYYTKQCQTFFEQKYGFNKCLLTTSCTDALEMCAILLDIQPGDEVIVPSFTFVSSANAFILHGAKIRFADSQEDNPNIDPNEIERLINPKTKAIILVHYAGVACDMDQINAIASKHNLFVIEDAAQAIDSYYKTQPLGSIGHMATFSFHETKNVSCGEGGMLVINDERFEKRAEIIWEKGTNRAAFWRGEVDKYNWVDVGSSFLPSEISAAFLFAQLQELDAIQSKRLSIWNKYHQCLKQLNIFGVELPSIQESNNAHLFYLILNSEEERDQLISYLKKQEITAVFHYISLHSSPYFIENYKGVELPNSDRFSNCLLRLPLYNDMTESEQNRVIEAINAFFNQ